MNIHTIKTNSGKDLIYDDFISNLPKKEKAKAIDTLEKIESEGLEAFEYLNTRQLIKKLWEIKLSKSRFMYVIADEENLYILHACKKQKGKAEKVELDTAIQRARILGEKLNKNFV
jgi:phage-related protein